MYIYTDLHLLSYSHVQYSLGQGIGQGRGDVKDCVIQGLEDFPHMEQSYENCLATASASRRCCVLERAHVLFYSQ